MCCLLSLYADGAKSRRVSKNVSCEDGDNAAAAAGVYVSGRERISHSVALNSPARTVNTDCSPMNYVSTVHRPRMHQYAAARLLRGAWMHAAVGDPATSFM